MASPTGCRCVTRARTSICCAGVCAHSRATSSSAWPNTRWSQLLTTIDGIGPQTAACILAEVGDPTHFASLSALASYVASRACGSRGNARKTRTAPPVPLGNARLRRTVDADTIRRPRQSVAARLLSATARGRQTRQSRAGGRHAQVDGRSLQCRQTSPAIHAGACFPARRGRRGHPWRLASRKLYASVSETFLTGAHGI